MLASVNIQRELEAAQERLKDVDQLLNKTFGFNINSQKNHRAGIRRDREEESEAQYNNSQFNRTAFNTRDGNKSTSEDESEVQSMITPTILNASHICEVKKTKRISAMKRLGPPNYEKVVNEELKMEINEDDEYSSIPSSVLKGNGLSGNYYKYQSNDIESRARNKRMFGALLGTLHKFKQEEVALQAKVAKRAQVEQKLEEIELREKEVMKERKLELFTKRRQQQIEIRHLEFQLCQYKRFEEWEKSKMPLLQCIGTKAPPKIYYQPKIHNKKSKKRLRNTQKNVKKMIQEKKEKVDQAIADFIAYKRPRSVVVVEEKVVKDKSGYRSPLEEGEIEDSEPEEETKSTPQIKDDPDAVQIIS